MTGITFEMVSNLSWPETYEKAVNGEIDMLSAVAKTVEREQVFNFSQMYYRFRRVIVVHSDEKEIKDLNDLREKTVAVQRNSSHHSYLNNFVNINLSLYDTVEEALTAVSVKSERAFVGNLATTDYLIKNNGIPNLKLIAFEGDRQLGLYFAVRKDWPELVSILNKAVNQISEEEKAAINAKWIDLDTYRNYDQLVRILYFVGAGIAIVFIVSIYWIRRLQKEIKERERIQKELQKARLAADEANEHKSSFLARMSHEIRTPLNAIIGLHYLIEKTKINPIQQNYVYQSKQAATTMLDLINDILDYAKVEAGKIELENVSFNLDEVIQKTINIISYKVKEKSIAFNIYKDPTIQSWYQGDGKRLEQILLNILNNAVKFTDQGHVNLRIEPIMQKDKPYNILFNISDTGIGMDQQQVNNLFMPFVQADESISRRFGGSGLGLSIVKSLIELMNGNIIVNSEKDVGSSFLLELFLAPDLDKQNQDDLILKEAFSSLKAIGFITNDNIEKNLYLEIFANYHIKVDHHSNFSEIRNTHYDVLVIDYDALKQDGGNVMNDITRANGHVANKTIILMPFDDDEALETILHSDSITTLVKPIVPITLIRTLYDLSQNKQEKTDNSIDKVYDYDKKILLAEDNKTNQLIVTTLLNQIGINTLVADDGAIAVKMFENQQLEIALVLMDLHMPVLNGYEASKQIRTFDPNVPIIAMTADVIADVKQHCEDCGMTHFLTKPFEPDQFINLIKQLMTNSIKKPIALLNKEHGLRTIGNDENLYSMILQSYLNENINTINNLRSALKDNDFKTAEAIVHKLKSSTGSIGATPLYNLLVEMQNALKEFDQKKIKHIGTKFYPLFTDTINEIKQQFK